MPLRPLAQRRFLITRPESQSAGLAALLEAAGAIPLLAPMIDIAPTDAPDQLAAAIAGLSSYQLAVFVSPSALDAVAAQLAAWPSGLPAAVVGPGSRDRAHEIGIQDIICPASQFDSEGLLAEPRLQNLEGQRVVLFRGNGGRELLAETLAARGARLDVVEAYQRQQPGFRAEDLQTLLADGCDGVIMTSSEAVHNLFTLADDELTNTLRNLRFFCAHPRVGEAIRQHGVAQVHLTATGDTGLLAGLLDYFAIPEETAAPVNRTPSAWAMPASTPHTPQKSRSKRRRLPRHALWAGGAALVAVVVALVVQQSRMDALQTKWQRELIVATAPDKKLAEDLERQISHTRQMDGRISAFEQRLEEIRSQQSVLSQQFSTLAGDQEAGLLADAELTLSLASQQLQLTSNVSAALAALYRLDERLAGFNKPMLANLRRAIARDIDALKRTPYVDRVGTSTRIDVLAAAIDYLPLRVDAKATGDTLAAEQAKEQVQGLNRVIRTVGAALGAFVQIRRMDQPDAVLLAPAQALYLRENIKLRLLNARLALLQHEETTYQRDIAAAEAELRRHFDVRAKPVMNALTLLKELLAVRPHPELTDLSVSIAAARDARRSAGKANPS